MKQKFLLLSSWQRHSMFLWMNCALQKNKEKAGFQFSWSLAFSLSGWMIAFCALPVSHHPASEVISPTSTAMLYIGNRHCPITKCCRFRQTKKEVSMKPARPLPPDSHATIIPHIMGEKQGIFRRFSVGKTWIFRGFTKKSDYQLSH